MKNKAFLSVVIPLYNKRKSIRRTLSTVMNQTYSDFEVLVIDDGSTDGSMDEIADLHDPRIRRIQKQNSGVSDTRNLGMREAKSDYVAFLDGDDLWEEHYLERVNDMIQYDPDCGLYMQDSRDIPASQIEQYPMTDGIHMEIESYDDWEHYFYHRNFKTSALTVNRNKALALGGFDSTLTIGEDLDLWFRLLLSHKVCFLDEVRVHILIYESDYHSRPVPTDYRKHFSYKLVTQPQLYLSMKDNRDVRRVMNKIVFFAWLCFTKDQNKEAVQLLKKHIKFCLLNYKDKIKYVLYHLGLFQWYLQKL